MDDLNKLISDINHGKLFTSYDIAIRTVTLLEELVAKNPWTTAQELIDLVKFRIKIIVDMQPEEVTCANIMRHILKLIRQEYEAESKSKGEGQSLHEMVTSFSETTGDYSKPLNTLRSSILSQLAEYKVELETSTDNIAAQATEHIHSNEIILTIGKSNTVEQFLKTASKERKFTVIVVECAPSYHGHAMSVNLAKGKIQTILISDAAVFAIMSRVNKVIIGTRAVMADGGLRAVSGTNIVALAAKHYSVPILVLAHMYKLTPVHVSSHHQETFNICGSPAGVLPNSAGPILNQVVLANPLYDYVRPELVTLFISHQGSNSPSYVYQLLSELYYQADYDV